MAETGYPILEFDRDPNAKINPEMMAEGQFSTDKLVITFFPEVMEQLKAEGKIRLEQTIAGENPILVYRFTDADVLIILGAIGCPACAGTLDQLHAMGIQKVMFCGGGGVLDPNIGVGQLLLVEGAIRDEGFSYHYIEPSRIIYTEEPGHPKDCRLSEGTFGALSARADLDDRCHLSGNTDTHRKQTGRGRQNRRDGAGGLHCRCAVSGIFLWSTDLRRG